MGSNKEASHYSEEFKWRVVEEVLSGKYNKDEARRIYGIKSNSAILYWMRKFSGNDGYRSNHSFGEGIKDMQSSKEIKELQQRIQQLEQELQRANLRADLWEKMIEVAERQLNIEIKKKPGAQLLKSSKEKKRR